MRRIVISVVLSIACGFAQAQTMKTNGHVSCTIDSKYNLSTYRSAFVFSQDSGTPAQVAIGGGKLFVDGREAQLSSEDRARIEKFETELRQLMPEVKQVTLEGIDIAFSALIEVARGLSSDPQATIASLDSAHKRLIQAVDSKPMSIFDKNAVEAVVKPIVSEFVPVIAGDAVSMALKAAFASESERKAMETRLQKMEQDIDSKIQPRAEQLEPLANAICQRLERMNALDDALSYRLPGGQPLGLLNVDKNVQTRKQ